MLCYFLKPVTYFSLLFSRYNDYKVKQDIYYIYVIWLLPK